MNARDMIRPWCVVCGRPATNKHHEPPKGIGGIGKKGIEPPVISLCGSGTTGCHGMRHAGKIKFRWHKNRWEWKAYIGGVWSDWNPTIEQVEEWEA